MDSAFLQHLASTNQIIDNLIAQRAPLVQKSKKGTISDDEEAELAKIDEQLVEAKENKDFTCHHGVDTAYRRWSNYVLDETVFPEPGFGAEFEKISTGGALRIFPELEVTVVETTGAKKRKLNETDIFDNSFPRDIHLVAVEAKVSIGGTDLWKCIRVDAHKENKRVWGVLSNAEQWQFIFIDQQGMLWRSDKFVMELRSYDESNVLPVYRFVHYIVKCCHEACTPPPSHASSTTSLHQ
ncbi:hypothetical protein BC829DRAFT_384822 [Chytridium lagenaria]|nr:hypothetical protein BC829DRAFT_384822 [Chytridium lagenaria]